MEQRLHDLNHHSSSLPSRCVRRQRTCRTDTTVAVLAVRCVSRGCSDCTVACHDKWLDYPGPSRQRLLGNYDWQYCHHLSQDETELRDHQRRCLLRSGFRAVSQPGRAQHHLVLSGYALGVGGCRHLAQSLHSYLPTDSFYRTLALLICSVFLYTNRYES